MGQDDKVAAAAARLAERYTRIMLGCSGPIESWDSDEKRALTKASELAEPTIRAVIRDSDNEIARLRSRVAELESALFRIMHYAHTGASVCDVNISEQPEFMEARRVLRERMHP